MSPPPPGLATPATSWRVLRADRLALRIEGRRAEVDLLGCRAPAPETEDGRAARHFLEAWLEEATPAPLTVWLPLQTSVRDLVLHWESPRLAGRVWCGDTDLAALLLAHGHARPTCPE